MQIRSNISRLQQSTNYTTLDQEKKYGLYARTKYRLLKDTG